MTAEVIEWTEIAYLRRIVEVKEVIDLKSMEMKETGDRNN